MALREMAAAQTDAQEGRFYNGIERVFEKTNRFLWHDSEVGSLLPAAGGGGDAWSHCDSERLFPAAGILVKESRRRIRFFDQMTQLSNRSASPLSCQGSRS